MGKEKQDASKVRRCLLHVIATYFLCETAVQAMYFVGLIGFTTYVLGGDASQVALLMLIFNGIFSASLAGMGVILDRVGAKRTIRMAFIAFCVLGIIGVFLPENYWILLVYAAALSAVQAATSAGLDAWPRYFTDNIVKLGKTNSLNSTARSLAMVVGPALAGTMTLWVPTQTVFALLTVFAIPSLILVEHTPEGIAYTPNEQKRGEEQQGKTGSFGTELAEGMRVVWEDWSLRTIFLIGFFGFFSYGAFDSLESLFYRDVLQVGSSWLGWLSALAGVGAFVGSASVLKLKERHFNMLNLAILLGVTGVGSFIYVATNKVGIASVGQVLCGIGFGALTPVRLTLTQRSCPVEQIGRVTSLMRMGFNLSGVIPLLLAPGLAKIFGVQMVLVAASLFSTFVAIFYIVSVKAHQGTKRA